LGKAIRSQFLNYFPDPEKFRSKKKKVLTKKSVTGLAMAMQSICSTT